MNRQDIEKLNYEFSNKSPRDIICYALERFGESRTILASSLSIEDQVLTEIFAKNSTSPRIFFIDTGRHFQSTYDLMEETSSRYGFKYEVYAPSNEQLEKIVSEYGPNMFYESVDLRKKCCEVRKVEPLKRVLATVDVWVCGLRREQSFTRKDIEVFEWDYAHQKLKINPLAYWSEEQVWEYIRSKNIPYNSLYNKDFRSIGCQPCTRAVKKGEDVRSGRWWWEDPDKKECGLHVANVIKEV